MSSLYEPAYASIISAAWGPAHLTLERPLGTNGFIHKGLVGPPAMGRGSGSCADGRQFYRRLIGEYSTIQPLV